MKKALLCLLAAVLCLPSALCQTEGESIPADIFYLMPEFGQGTVFFKGRAPFPAQLNICAIDGSVRYKDAAGQERIIQDDGSLTAVSIGDASFIMRDGFLVRQYPLNLSASLVVQRKVDLMADVKVGAFGMETRTAAINNYDNFANGGQFYNLDQVKDQRYRLYETVYLFHGGQFSVFNKRNCQKCFPGAKDAIDAWFKEHRNPTAEDLPAILEACRSWAQ